MARRPFDPAAHGWTKTEYRQGDILDRAAVDALVADVDVVVHLAFVIMGSREESAQVNLAAPATSSRPPWPPTGPAAGLHLVGGRLRLSPRQPGSHHRGRADARHTRALLLGAEGRVRSRLAETTAGSSLEVFVLRPCIVAGPKAPALADAMPWNQLPGPVSGHPGAAAAETADPRPRHPGAIGSPRRRRSGDRFGRNHDRTARAHTTSPATECYRCPMWPGAGRPSGQGAALRDVRTSEVFARLPFVPSALEWLHVGRTSVVMDTSKAKSQLGWHAELHRRRDIGGAGGDYLSLDPPMNWLVSGCRNEESAL